MTSWNQFPLIRLFPFLFCGIISANLFCIPFVLFYTLCALFLSCLLVIQLKGLGLSYRNDWVFGVFTGLLIICMGNQLAIINSEKQSPNHISHKINTKKDQIYLGEIIDNPIKKEKSWKVALSIKALKEKENWISQSGKVILYISHSFNTLPLQYGDEIVFCTRLYEPNGVRNPGGFDHRAYLSQNQIYYLGYIREQQWAKTKPLYHISLKNYAFKLQQKTIEYFQKMGFQSQSLGVASALLIGDRNHIQPNTKKAFSSAGTMHILAVSGLHVGIIYLLFAQLLKFIRGKWATIIKTFLLLSVLWSYAMITGLSPSVVRAAAMFSFFVIGKAINRHAEVLNIVCVSLALLLIIDPSLLFSVGFQLSYSAVIAIVIVYPWIYKRLIFKNWILDKVWSISCVSICAQIGTLPLVIFYFHQFPNYFLFSNLLVIPLVPLLIISGLLALLFFYIPILNNWTGYLFQFLVDTLIQIVKFFDNLPYNVTSGIYPDLWDVFIIYLIVVFSGYWLLAKRKWGFIVSLGLCLCLIGKSFLDSQLESSQNIFVVYDSKDQPVYDLIIGSHCYETGPTNNLSSFNRGAIDNSRAMMGVTSNQPLSSTQYNPDHLNANALVVSKGLIQYNDNRIVLAKDRYQVVYESPIVANWLIVSNSYRGAIHDLKILFSPKSIVFDSTVRGKLLTKWLQDCSEMGIDSYSVHNSGAFVAQL